MRALSLAALTALAMAASAAQAKVISFEDLPGFNSLTGYGVGDTYEGYDWGFGLRGGFDQKVMEDSRWGWGVSSTSAFYNPPPYGVDGDVFAWSANGPQSLWIDFRTPTPVISVDFAQMTARDEPSNASTMRMFGYDATGAVLFSTTVLSLTDTFKTLSADPVAVRFLEMRAEDDRKFFAVDKIVLGGVPEPRTWGLMILGFGLMGQGLRLRRMAPIPR